MDSPELTRIKQIILETFKGGEGLGNFDRVDNDIRALVRFISPGVSEERENELIERFIEKFKGGEGSGNFGHEGRPGEVGGSSPSHIQSEPGGRAEGGGLTQGINQSLYAGGQFLPMSPEGKAEKYNQKLRKDYSGKRIEIGPGEYDNPPTVDHVAIYPSIMQVTKYDRETHTLSLIDNPTTLRYFNALPGSANYHDFVTKINLFNSGQRWEFNPEKAARMRHEKTPSDFAKKESS